jgi:transcriptional regulator GlxA family with amidase domain
MRFGVFIYDGVEPIDLATFGVLSMARRIAPQISIATLAPAAGTVTLANGLQVLAGHGIDAPPPLDALIVTGGPGWQAQAAHAPTLAYLRAASQRAVVASVCTGGMILAASGLLDGLQATTKCEVVAGQEIPPVALMRERHPLVDVVERRVVDTGRIVTGGGVSLCIDVTLHLLARLVGQHVADETARILEYRHALAANRAAFDAHD